MEKTKISYILYRNTVKGHKCLSSISESQFERLKDLIYLTGDVPKLYV